MLGRTLGRFTITAPLGEGGIATVWKATDGLLGRTVAVKVLRPEYAQDRKARLRFLREARNHASLDHPGIVAVLDYGECDGCVYLALALIEGRTVSALVGDALLPVPHAVRIAFATCDALSVAHQRVPPLVHRDVTGRNVMVCQDGRVQVLDFGLAVVAGRTRLTSSGRVIGTPAFVAPELIDGDEPTPRSDVFSLGVLAYELLASDLPFAMEHPDAVAGASLQKPRPLRSLRPEVPPPLEAVVMRAISRSPADRHADAAELRDALAPWRSTTDSGPTRDPIVARTEPARGGPSFVAIAPFEPPAPASDPDGEGGRLAARLPATLEAALARAAESRVVPVPDSARNGGDREIAEAAGANIVVRGAVHRSGTQLRVTFVVRDPIRALDRAGGVVDGSALQPFELEDHVARELAARLDAHAADTLEAPARDDPVAAERLLQARAWLRRYDDEASIDGAIRALERLSATNQPEVFAQLTRAFLYKHQLTGERKWMTHAGMVCERARTADLNHPEVQTATGDITLSAGKLDAAESAFRAALARAPGLLEAQLGLARVLSRKGCGDEARALVEQAIAEHPEDWRAPSLLGHLAFLRGDYERALRAWQQVVRLTPDNTIGLRNVGSALYRLDRVDEAIAAYRRSIEIQPNARAYSNLATALYYSGRMEEAADAFRKAANLNPLEAVWWGNLGNACRHIPGREHEAAQHLELAVSMAQEHLSRHPQDVDAWGRLSGWLVNLGEHEAARRTIAHTLTLAPGDPDVLVRSGHVHLQCGELGAARRDFRRAVRAGYGVQELLHDPDMTPLMHDAEFRAWLDAWRGGSPEAREDSDEEEGREEASNTRA